MYLKIKNQKPFGFALQIYSLFLFRINLIKNFSRINIFLLITFLAYHTPNCKAQQNLRYQLQLHPKEIVTLAHDHRLKTVYTDSLLLKQNLQRFIHQLQIEGYLSANLDLLHYEAKQRIYAATIYLGNPVSQVQIRQGNIPSDLWTTFTNDTSIYSLKEWYAMQKNIIEKANNGGYPFASISLKSLRLNTSQALAEANFRTGPLVRFDSLVIEGEARINTAFLAHYIGWKHGEPYHEKKANEAIRLIQQLSYLKLKTAPKQFFKYDRAYLKIELLPVKNTQLDGIIGLLLNDQTGTGRKPVITGSVDLKLQNPFGKGKNIQFAFQRLRLGAQLFDLHYEHPDLLRTHLTLKANFYSLREDSLFNNLRRSIALQHQANWGKLAFKAGVIDSRLTFSEQQLTTTNLQSFGSNKITAYGLQYTHQRLDRIRSPRKGFSIDGEISIGNKVIRPSITDDDPLFEEIYGAIDLKSLQVSSRLDGRWFQPIGEQGTLYSRIQAGKLFSNRLFQNDLFRLGGIRTLRGFNENAFFASTFAIASLEYRIYTTQRSYFLAFIDQAYFDNEVEGFNFHDFPIGLGIGLAINTKGGLFRLIYSLGNAQGQPIGFRQAKIHFGLTSFL